MLWILAILLPTRLLAQGSGDPSGTRQLRGHVREEGSGALLSSAQIHLRGTTTGAYSGEDGSFVLRVPATEVVLLVRLIGYSPVTVSVAPGESDLSITLKRDALKLDYVVVSGHATGISRRHAASSVTALSGEDVTRVSHQSIEHALQGKIPGAQIAQRTGAPGGGNWVRLRGISSIYGGTITPLYVVDGVIVSDDRVTSGQSFVSNGLGSDSPPNRITDLDPNDIESIEVLKGSAAAAIYGSKASAGVILITTRRGVVGRPRWSLSVGTGTSRLAYPNGQRAWRYDDAVEYFGPSAAQYFDSVTHAPKRVLDYEKLAYGEHPWHSDVSLSVSGGSVETRYFASLLARDEGGIVPRTGARKHSLRANLDQVISDRATLQFGTSLMRTQSDRGLFDNANSPFSTVGYELPRIPQFLDLRQRPDGFWPENPFGLSNPLQTIALVRNREEVWRSLTSAQLRWTLLESPRHDIRLVTVGGADALVQRFDVFSPPELEQESYAPEPGAVMVTDHRALMANLNVNAVHEWRPGSGVRATTQVGTQYERWDRDMLFAGSRNLGGGLEVPQAGTRASFVLGDERLRVEDLGLFAQSEWLFDERFLITVGARADRSSANADAGRFHLFPKASASLRLQNPGIPLPGGARFGSNVVDELKLRLAYGETGTRPQYGDRFTALGQVNIAGTRGFFTPFARSAPDLRPERQREIEAGFDASLLRERASLDLTAFQHDVDDLLLIRTPPPSTGYTSELANVGALRVRGLEATLMAVPVSRGAFHWASRMTFGMNRSVVRRLSPSDSVIILGTSLGNGQVWLRAGRSATEIMGQDTLPEPGTPVSLGSGAPDWTAGWSNELRWGPLSLYALLDHQRGGRLWAGTWGLYEGARNSRDYDVPAGDGRSVGEVRAAARGRVTRLLNQDATYTKLREVTLGYELSPRSARRLWPGAHSARLQLSGRNLVWWTGLRGTDPEFENFFAGRPYSTAVQRNRELAAYPASRTFWLTLRMEY